MDFNQTNKNAGDVNNAGVGAAMEWQYLGDNDWWFGRKVRGLVRDVLVRIYFLDDRNGGEWYWKTKDAMRPTKANSFVAAVEAAEAELRNLNLLPEDK